MLTIGQLARRAGATAKAVRYYEALGLLGTARRAGNNYRVYDERSMDRLLFIRRAKLLGLTLDEIRELLEAAPGGCQQLQGEVEELVARKIRLCEQQIGELAALQQSLEERLLTLKAEGGGESGGSPLSADCRCLPVDAREIAVTP